MSEPMTDERRDEIESHISTLRNVGYVKMLNDCLSTIDHQSEYHQEEVMENERLREESERLRKEIGSAELANDQSWLNLRRKHERGRELLELLSIRADRIRRQVLMMLDCAKPGHPLEEQSWGAITSTAEKEIKLVADAVKQTRAFLEGEEK